MPWPLFWQSLAQAFIALSVLSLPVSFMVFLSIPGRNDKDKITRG